MRCEICGADRAMYIVVELRLRPGVVVRVPGGTWRCTEHGAGKGARLTQDRDKLIGWIRSELVRRLPEETEAIRGASEVAFSWGGSSLTEEQVKKLETEWEHRGVGVDEGRVKIPIEHVSWQNYADAVRGAGGDPSKIRVN